ncbi:MAG: hypothetical protein AVDCRST_MAG77-5875, partial [uncultured Chloroflexi bacterium]
DRRGAGRRERSQRRTGQLRHGRGRDGAAVPAPCTARVRRPDGRQCPPM